MKKLISFCLLTILYSLFTVSAYAQTCQPIYGGGQSCPAVSNILIDKKILNPTTNEFVDNLGIDLTDPKFSPLSPVFFKINVVNTGNTLLSSVRVQDVFPQFIDFASGPGIFDANSKILSFELFNLNPNEGRDIFVIGRIMPSQQLPKDAIFVCNLVNTAQVTAITPQGQAIINGNPIIAQDTAKFCIQKQVVSTPTPTPIPQVVVVTATPTPVSLAPQIIVVTPTPAPVVQIPVQTKGGLPVLQPAPQKATPATGPEALTLLGLIPTGWLGYFIRKKAIV